MYAWLPRLQPSNCRAGEELLCEREPRNTKDSIVMPSASCGNIFHGFNIRGLTSSANTAKISPPRN